MRLLNGDTIDFLQACASQTAPKSFDGSDWISYPQLAKNFYVHFEIYFLVLDQPIKKVKSKRNREVFTNDEDVFEALEKRYLHRIAALEALEERYVQGIAECEALKRRYVKAIARTDLLNSQLEEAIQQSEKFIETAKQNMQSLREARKG